MADAICAELMQGMKEKAEWLAGIVWRKKDVATKKCPKCGNVNYGKVCVDNLCGVHPDAHIVTYCPGCWAIHDTDEIPIE